MKARRISRSTLFHRRSVVSCDESSQTVSSQFRGKLEVNWNRIKKKVCTYRGTTYHEKNERRIAPRHFRHSKSKTSLDEKFQDSNYPHGFLLGGLFLLGFLLQFVVRHRDNGEDQVHEIEGPEEDDHDEEEHVPRSGRSQHQLVQILPVILRHETKGGEQRPAEGVETRVAVIRIIAVSL